MPSQKLRHYLDTHHVPYKIIPHDVTYTAQETAASAHVSGKDFAKTVIVRIDGKLSMIVLPATHNLSIRKLKEETGAQEVEIVSEQEFTDRFSDCEIGAMPPFGNLYDMETIMEDSLAGEHDIFFNAGTHRETFGIPTADFREMVRPKIVHLS